MKLFLAAIAIAVASPAAAQTAGSPHAGHNMATHAQHAQTTAPAATPGCTPEHAAMGHCTLQPSPAKAADAADGCCDKGPDGKMACCEKMKAGKKGCCDKGDGNTAGAHAGHQGH